MHALLAVADEILRLAKRRGLSLTPMQLMKLTYMSFGWFMANRGERLFPERIEAWKYGPVMPDLYRATKAWGRNPIPLDHISDELGAVDADTSSFLSQVVDKYGHLSGIALSNLTHNAGTPWHQVFSPGVMGIEIPEAVIAEHYREILNERRSPASA